MTLEEIRRVAIYEMGFNPRKDDNVDLLARFALAVLDALEEVQAEEERTALSRFAANVRVIVTERLK